MSKALLNCDDDRPTEVDLPREKLGSRGELEPNNMTPARDKKSNFKHFDGHSA